MPLKLPPPAPIAIQDPTLNRWFLELTGILQAGGGIAPDAVEGLPEVIDESAQNAVDIIALQNTTGGQGGSITTLQNEVTALQNDVVVINGALTSLGARAQVLNGAGAPAAGLGNVNDWYANIGGAVGARIYVKTAPAVWTPFPF